MALAMEWKLVLEPIQQTLYKTPLRTNCEQVIINLAIDLVLVLLCLAILPSSGLHGKTAVPPAVRYMCSLEVVRSGLNNKNW